MAVPVGAQRPPQRLYLVARDIDVMASAERAAFGRDLDAALGAADVAAVLLRLGSGDERAQINHAKAAAAMVQRHDVALLLDGHPDIVGRVGADGAHLSGIEAFTAAIGSLKPDRIAGAGGLRSRHDAMLAAEGGADYVMFGEPDRRGSGPPFDVVIERVTWWAELLEIPCVGYAATLDEVRPLALAGADFIALGDWIWTHPQGAVAAIAAGAESIAERAA